MSCFNYHLLDYSQGQKGNFSLHHHIQTSFEAHFGAHPTFCPMDTGGSFSRIKVARAWSWLLTSI